MVMNLIFWVYISQMLHFWMIYIHERRKMDRNGDMWLGRYVHPMEHPQGCPLYYIVISRVYNHYKWPKITQVTGVFINKKHVPPLDLQLISRSL